MVKANLRVLLSCLHCCEFRVYVKAFDWSALLEQLCNTTSPAIQLASKIVGCSLSFFNPQLFIGLSETDINQMLNITAKAAGSSYKLNEFRFCSLDMIMCLQTFIDQGKSDIFTPLQGSLLPVVVSVFSSGTLEEKTAISLLLWSYLSSRNYDLSGDLAYSNVLPVFNEICEDDEDLKLIIKCISASYVEKGNVSRRPLVH